MNENHSQKILLLKQNCSNLDFSATLSSTNRNISQFDNERNGFLLWNRINTAMACSHCYMITKTFHASQFRFLGNFFEYFTSTCSPDTSDLALNFLFDTDRLVLGL